jgi:hypothetical protein
MCCGRVGIGRNFSPLRQQECRRGGQSGGRSGVRCCALALCLFASDSTEKACPRGSGCVSFRPDAPALARPICRRRRRGKRGCALAVAHDLAACNAVIPAITQHRDLRLMMERLHLGKRHGKQVLLSSAQQRLELLGGDGLVEMVEMTEGLKLLALQPHIA